jgi:hypothetical protein
MVSNRAITEGHMGSKSQEEEGKPWIQIKVSPFPVRLKNTLSSLIVSVFPSKYQASEFIFLLIFAKFLGIVSAALARAYFQFNWNSVKTSSI